MIGFINLFKEEGYSSAKAVSKIKRIFNAPCGHMGTLDPMASGVLPVGIGKATRLFPYMIEKKKEYVSEFTFGEERDTLDKTGLITNTTSHIPTEEEIRKVLPLFIGEVEQIPPKYSAKCIDGKRGYQLARQGVDFTLSPKKVMIYGLELLERTGDKSFSFKITCGGGTYIRSIARDLGKKLNSLAYMSKLERRVSGIFTIETAVNIEDLERAVDISEYLILPDIVVNYPKIVLNKDKAKKLLDGVYEKNDYDDGLYRVYNENLFYGIGQVSDKILKMKSYVKE